MILLQCIRCGEYVERRNRIATVTCFDCKKKAKKIRHINKGYTPKHRAIKLCETCGEAIPSLCRYCTKCRKERVKGQHRESTQRFREKRNAAPAINA